MFEKLFTYPAVLKRHRECHLARERAVYLEMLASQEMARDTAVASALWPELCCEDPRRDREKGGPLHSSPHNRPRNINHRMWLTTYDAVTLHVRICWGTW